MADFSVSTQLIVTSNAGRLFQRTTKTIGLFSRDAKSSFRQAGRASSQFERTFSRNIDRLQQRAQAFRGITGGILAADLIRKGLRGATSAFTAFFTEAGKVEKAEVDFRVLFNSIEKGKQTVVDLRKLTLETPFSFRGLAATANLLLNMGVTTRENLIPMLRQVGDLAKGDEDRLLRIAFAAGEIATNSKASFQEIRQFTNAQVALLPELAKQWKVNTAAARKMVTQGRATLPEMTKAFKAMTSAGGKFFRATELGAKTLPARFVRLKDTVLQFAATIGKAMLPEAKKWVDLAIKVTTETIEWAKANQGLITEKFVNGLERIKNFGKDIWPIFKGIGKAFTIMLPVVEKLAPILPIMAAGWLLNKVALGGLSFFLLAKDIKLVVNAVRTLTGAQWLWNASVIANPIGLIITGIIVLLTALGVGIFLVVKNWDFLKEKGILAFKGIGTFAKETFFEILSMAFFVIGGIIKLFAIMVSKLGDVFGIEFTAFDALSEKISEIHRKLLIKAGLRFPVEPIPGKIDLLAHALGIPQGGFTFGIQPVFRSPLSAAGGVLPFAPGRSPSAASTPAATDSTTDTPGLNIPFFAGFNKQVIEHLVKLDFGGLPQGTKVSVDTGGNDAPPIIINMLGENP